LRNQHHAMKTHTGVEV